MKKIKIPKDYLKGLGYKVEMPTFICACGKEVLDTPTNRKQSYLYRLNN